MPLPEPPRYDLRSLVRAVFGPGPIAREMDHDTMHVEAKQSAHDIITDARIALALKVERRTIQRWWRDGMSFVQAEAACERIRLHPLCVWPDFYDGAMAYIEAAADAADKDRTKREKNREYHREYGRRRRAAAKDQALSAA